MMSTFKDFIEKKRQEGLSDEAIEELVREKFNLSGGGFTKVFSPAKYMIYHKRKAPLVR